MSSDHQSRTSFTLFFNSNYRNKDLSKHTSFIHSAQLGYFWVPGSLDIFYLEPLTLKTLQTNDPPALLTVTHHSPATPAVTCAALRGDVVCWMSGLAAGWCVGALPPAPRLLPCHHRCHSTAVTFSSSEPYFTSNMSDGVTACCCAACNMLWFSMACPLARVSVTPLLQPRTPDCSNLVFFIFFPACHLIVP